jgi:hypothetical protein
MRRQWYCEGTPYPPALNRRIDRAFDAERPVTFAAKALFPESRQEGSYVIDFTGGADGSGCFFQTNSTTGTRRFVHYSLEGEVRTSTPRRIRATRTN